MSGGIALGVFVGLLPLPGQTALAVLAALLLRVNLPLAAVSVWISNPITFVPIFYFAYRVGAMLLGIPHETMPPEASLAWLTEEIALHWRPLMYGSLLMATSVASMTYLGVSTVWHVLTRQRYRQRHRGRKDGTLKKAALPRAAAHDPSAPPAPGHGSRPPDSNPYRD